MTSTPLIFCFDQVCDVENFLFVLNKERGQGRKPQVILKTKGFSRNGRMELQECLASAKLLRAQEIECFFQWDILMVESIFLATCEVFKKIDMDLFTGIRVQDPGALHFLKEEGFKGQVHYITDQGNHNLLGLQRWLAFWPQAITRLVLSPEIPSSSIKQIQASLGVEIEVLAAGPILLFYTPRHLVTPLYGNEEEASDHSLVWGTSEESPHKGFPIVENQHGTFMFNTKELFILDEKKAVEELCETSKIFFRVDYALEPLKRESLFEFLKLTRTTFTDQATSKAVWKDFLKGNRSMATTKGFFRTNKTDVLFKKLKSDRLKGEQEHYLGEVVDVKKKKHIGIRLSAIDEILRTGDEIELTSPEGNKRQCLISSMRNAEGQNLEEAREGQIIFIEHVGGISVKTTVCRNV